MRNLVLAFSLVLTGAIAVSAQNHPQSHSDGRSHDGSAHVPMDPALHGIIHGDWQGTMTAPEGVSTTVALRVASDQGKLTLRVASGQASRLGASSEVVLDGTTVRWMQDVSGKPCRTAATVTAATTMEPETLKGTMSCADGETTFALRKTK